MIRFATTLRTRAQGSRRSMTIRAAMTSTAVDVAAVCPDSPERSLFLTADAAGADDGEREHRHSRPPWETKCLKPKRIEVALDDRLSDLAGGIRVVSCSYLSGRTCRRGCVLDVVAPRDVRRSERGSKMDSCGAIAGGGVVREARAAKRSWKNPARRYSASDPVRDRAGDRIRPDLGLSAHDARRWTARSVASQGRYARIGGWKVDCTRTYRAGHRDARAA